METPDPLLEALMRAARPAPDPTWVRTTGEQLFPERRRRRTTLRLATALVVGLAALASVLSLAGVGPLGGTERSVEARDNCRSVTVTRTVRVPSVITAPDGAIRVVTKRTPVERTVRRCG